jgi:pimeloyl-ACP methyl ester carboxylesterase
MFLHAIDHLQRLSLVARGFRSRRVPTSIGRVHVLDAPGRGAGPPLVVLHGFSAAAVHFQSVLPSLRRHVRHLVAPDLPGHGFSDLPASGIGSHTVRTGLREALDAVIEEPVVLFGNSLGGLVAIRYAQMSPDKVRALVLCSPGGAPATREELTSLLANFRPADQTAALDFVDRLFARPPWYRRIIARGVRARFFRPAIRAFLDRIGPDDLLSAHDLRSVAVPTLVLWGRADRILPRADLEFFRTHLPKELTTIEEPDDFGHCPYLDRPRALVDRLARFTRGFS